MAETLRILVMLLLLVPLLLMAALAGCGHGEAEAPGSIAAKVNGDAIPVVHAASPQALEQVIDQALLAQQAREARLEREPGVAQALEDARRHVLAQAWLERLSTGAPRVSADEVRSFYAANPALFSERRIYYYEELTAAVPARLHGALAAEAAVAASLDEVALWLAARGVTPAGRGPAHVVRAHIRPAEEIPFIQLRRLADMREGELAVLPAQGGLAVVQLVQSRRAPVTEAEAATPIEHYLANRRRAELAKSEVKRLRQGAQIEYLQQQPRNRQDPVRGPVRAQQVSTTISRRQP